MTTTKWSDLSTYGRYLKRILNLLMNEIRCEEELVKKNENHQINTEKILPIINTLSRVSLTLVKLVEISHYEKRLTEIESLLKHIPREVLQEAKQRSIGNDSKSIHNY